MMVGPGKWVVLLVVVLLLFGYKKLPDITRSIGRSLRIAKGEILQGLDENDVRTRASAQTGRGPLGRRTATEEAGSDRDGTEDDR